MVSIPEIVTWVLGIVVFIYGITQYKYVQRIPQFVYLILSYCAILLAWTLTILAGFFWGNLLITMDHILQLVSAMMFTVWCYRIVFKVRKGA